MGRPRIWIAVVVAALCAGCVAAGASADADSAATDRAGFVKHNGPNWVWFGPNDWDAVYSAYGISIFAPPNDGSSIDYGGSSTLTDGTPKQHFKAARNRFAAIPGLSRVKFRKISRIKTNRPFNQGGTASQTMKFTARANGTNIGGELGYQYAIYTPDPQYAYQAQLYKGAVDDRNFKAAMKTVDAVWSATAYSGPGLPINPKTGLP